MSSQSWMELLYSLTADATAVTGTGEAIVVPDITLPANYMQPGRVLRAYVSGKISNVVTTPGTITLRARWGGVAGTLLATSGAISQNIVAQTDDQWEAEFIVTCRSIGGSGTFLTCGRAVMGNIVAASAGTTVLIPSGSNAAVTVSTIAATAITLTAQFSAASNSVTAQTYLLSSLN